jgi:hypothetical protein
LFAALPGTAKVRLLRAREMASSTGWRRPKRRAALAPRVRR